MSSNKEDILLVSAIYFIKALFIVFTVILASVESWVTLVLYFTIRSFVGGGLFNKVDCLVFAHSFFAFTALGKASKDISFIGCFSGSYISKSL